MNSDEAVALRTYASEVEASLAASRLGSEGIDVLIQKDDCGGAYPALQMTRGVKLLVKPEDLEQAETILHELETGGAGGAEEEEPQEEPQRVKSSPMLLIGLFLLGLAAGYFLSPSLMDRSTYTGVAKSDHNAKGTPGAFLHYVDGKLVRSEQDRNYDGKPDAWFKYEAGKIHTGTSDNNFDGEPDVWITYKDPFNYVMKVDTDFDGKADATVYYVDDLIQRTDWHPKDSSIIERRQLYKHGLLREELLDIDLDGNFDERIIYDRYERPISKTKLPR
jgi:hypothetical protein